MKVMYFINQFFAGLGGEDKADVAYGFFEGAKGPATALQNALPKDTEVVATLYCGDNYGSDHPEEFLKQALETIRKFEPDVLVAGPAFNAGRYGINCCRLLDAAKSEMGLPGVAAMSPDNPGVGIFRDCYIIPTGQSVASLSKAITPLATLAYKLGMKADLGPAADEGYIPRGIRLNVCTGIPAQKRAVDMIVARLAGKTFENEVPPVKFSQVAPPPPIENLAGATIALVTEGGIVPIGNPDHIPTRGCTIWKHYPLAGKDMRAGAYEAWHGGFITDHVVADPDRNVPYDALSDCADEKLISSVFPEYCVTTGNGGQVSAMTKIGQEMAVYLKENKVSGVILTST